MASNDSELSEVDASCRALRHHLDAGSKPANHRTTFRQKSGFCDAIGLFMPVFTGFADEAPKI
jgi:hypothetical protein